MSCKRLGEQTVFLPSRPGIISTAAFGCKMEGAGPLGKYFDCIIEDDTFGEKTWEEAESKLVLEATRLAIKKAGMTGKDVHYFMGGDLENQIMAASLAARALQIPFLGLYGACSTFGEGMGLAAMLLEGDLAETVAFVASSHFCTAERQYRFPLEYGNQRTPTAQWTVTGAGAAIMAKQGEKQACITHVTTGVVQDLGVNDANNMGAAMAPAAANTLRRHFLDTKRKPEDYDLIVTGDLGKVGHDILMELMRDSGFALSESSTTDCGMLIYDREKQDVHAGGSGCGCCATVFASFLLPGLKVGRWKKILFAPTGALISPTSSQQGESIPGVCHAVCLTSPREE